MMIVDDLKKICFFVFSPNLSHQRYLLLEILMKEKEKRQNRMLAKLYIMHYGRYQVGPNTKISEITLEN